MVWDAVGYPGRGEAIAGIADGIAVIGKATPGRTCWIAGDSALDDRR
jgi:hypothetical protein